MDETVNAAQRPTESVEGTDDSGIALVGSGAVGQSAGVAVNSEVPAGGRRRFSATYKRKILKETDACRDEGGVGEVLRREGLYSSHLKTWREQRERGELAGLAPGKRGRKSRSPKRLQERVNELERENSLLRQRLGQAERVMEVQKKVSALFGETLSNDVSVGSGSWPG